MKTTSSALLLAVVLVFAACGGSDGATTTTAAASTTAAPATTEAASATWTISGFAFGEAPTIAVGQELTVVNADGATHTWTSDDGAFDSGNIAGGSSFAFTFDAPGEYSFHCNIHGSMMGTVTVTG
jgi:plastocyanin